MAVLEAMAAGLPVVATDVGDNARVVENGTSGLVVPPENARALAVALARLLADAQCRRRMGQMARRRVERYSEERMVTRTLAIYASLTAKG